MVGTIGALTYEILTMGNAADAHRGRRKTEHLAVAGSDLEDLKILGRHLDRCFDTSDRTND
ncbi:MULTISPECIES: hypothetical protein [unclassified Nitrobacter]|uniref:hypothetical protein n=1 Tax=unclassified Nitrobacter TaxID=2620411 RepID=UPI001ACAC4E4|nr:MULTISPECIES: hypothetical protein [unclassified Nitrobacter]MBN9147982.1 hypothetical protein [Nitrobacter sp.]MBN9489855.1 hypothetical protein [Alphaproteobacteria bacterium]